MLLSCIYTILTAKKNILTIDFKGKRELALFSYIWKYVLGNICQSICQSNDLFHHLSIMVFPVGMALSSCL